MDAIDDLGDAIEASRNFLTPIRPGTWIRLAFVVVFVSSLGLGFSTSVPGSDVLTVTGDPAVDSWRVEDLDGTVPADELAAIGLALAGLVLAVWLCYALIAGVMEFVFLESLRSSEVRVRRYFAANVGKGVRLFCFRLGLLLAAAGLGAIPAAFVAAGGGSLTDLSPGLFGLYSFYGFALYLGYATVRRFTDEFVAPIMLLEDRSVIGAWGRFRKSLTANRTEYAVYLLLAWFLYIAVLIGAWIVVGIGLVALLIPVVIVSFGLVLLGPIGVALFVVVGPLSLAAALLFMGLVWAPITTFFRYYALLLLGDTDGDLDLVPDQRAAVRTADSAAVGHDDWAGVDRGPSGRVDRPSSDDGDPWEETDPRTDADGTGSWDDAGGADSDSGPDRDLWSEAPDSDHESDPWSDTDDSSSTDPWDEPSESDETTDSGEADSENEANGSNDTSDDDRTW